MHASGAAEGSAGGGAFGRPPQESLFQVLFDGMDDHVAVLDADGGIRHVNRAWRSFARENGPAENTDRGASYREVCRRAAAAGCTEAETFLLGFQRVIDGRQPRFEFSYSCHAPTERRWFTATVTRLETAGGVFAAVSHRPITGRVQAELALAQRSRDAARRARLNAATADLAGALLASGDIDEVSALLLDASKRLTGSRFGYVGYIEEATGNLVCPTMTRDVWDRCQVPDKQIVFDKFGGLWGWVLDHRRPLLTNAPGQDPRSTGLPEGHLAITRFLSVPVMIGDDLVGQIALANADRDYTDDDLEDLQRLAELYGLAVRRRREEKRLQEACEALDAMVYEQTIEIRDANQQLRHAVDTRMGVERALRETKARQTLAASAANDGLWDWSIETGDVWFDRRYYTMLGYAPGAFPPTFQSWVERVHPDDIGDARAAIDAHLEGRTEHFRIEFRFRNAAGKWVWLLGRGNIMERAADGRPLRMVGTHTDLSDMKRLETALAIERRRLEALLNALPAWVVLIGPDHRIRYANHYFTAHFDAKAGDTCHSALHGEDHPCRNCLTRSVLNTEQPASEELVAPDGRTYQVHAYPYIDEDGRPLVLELGIDITEQRRLQAEAVRAHQLASLGELAAGVAHEINNPINGIINYAQILADADDSAGGPEAAIPGRIIKEGERIAAIVRNLLSFARNQMEEMQPVAVPEVIEDALALMAIFLDKAGIRVERRVDAEARVRGNAQQLQQVILNLVSNARHAVEARPSGNADPGRIGIICRRRDGEDGRRVEIVVSDNGAGMSAEALNRACEPFFTTKPKGVGTGLGLSISHGIVRDHGGRLRFESEPGRFTRAIVDLPASDGPV